MKKLFFAILLIIFVTTANAQNAIAKIKYEQAEEAFSISDYLTTLTKLDEAEKLLGSVNPKILYLRIMSQDKLLDSDSSVLLPLRRNCQYYLKEYEQVQNVEEKYKHVYMVSDRLLQYDTNADFETGDRAFKTQHYEFALQHFKKAAASGFARAMTYLGIMNLYGYGMEKNMTEARRWFSRSADKGNGFGEYWLGDAFYYGYGGEKNMHQALQLFNKASAKNIISAFTGLGNIYYFENKDYQKAYHWYKKAAEKNDSYAQYMIAFYYLRGLVVAKDEAAALSWFTKALNNGYVSAMASIGSIYQNGNGVPKDYTQAFNWYTRGVEKGVYKCMLGLGTLYEEGLGVKKDKKLAQEWKNKALAAQAKEVYK